jgi:hypothetical protein
MSEEKIRVVMLVYTEKDTSYVDLFVRGIPLRIQGWKELIHKFTSKLNVVKKRFRLIAKDVFVLNTDIKKEDKLLKCAKILTIAKILCKPTNKFETTTLLKDKIKEAILTQSICIVPKFIITGFSDDEEDTTLAKTKKDSIVIPKLMIDEIKGKIENVENTTTDDKKTIMKDIMLTDKYKKHLEIFKEKPKLTELEELTLAQSQLDLIQSSNLPQINDSKLSPSQMVKVRKKSGKIITHEQTSHNSPTAQIEFCKDVNSVDHQNDEISESITELINCGFLTPGLFTIQGRFAWLTNPVGFAHGDLVIGRRRLFNYKRDGQMMGVTRLSLEDKMFYFNK